MGLTTCPHPPPAVAWWGVDGGRVGAACAVAEDGLTALWWAHWTRSPPPELPVAPGAVVALESTYFDPQRPAAGGALEGWYGELRGVLRPRAPVIVRPTASQWRRVLARPHHPSRETWKAAAVQAASRAPGLPDGMPVDLAEAWALARWVWAWDRAGRP